MRGFSGLAPMREFLGRGMLGGAMSLGAYWIAIWAMTVAPIALVAALRETSVLWATLIAVVFLKEPFIAARAVAAALIVAGVVAHPPAVIRPARQGGLACLASIKASNAVPLIPAASETGDPLLLTPGPLTTAKSVKEVMVHDWGSRDAAFLGINKAVLDGLPRDHPRRGPPSSPCRCRARAPSRSRRC